jgi:hypothetical protein
MSANRRTRTAKKRVDIAQPAEPIIRPLKDIQASIDGVYGEMDHLRAPFRDAAHRVSELQKEYDAHPDTLAASLANLRLGTEVTAPDLSASEPELGVVLTTIVNELELARAVVQTAWQAIESLNLGGADGLDDVLRVHADDPICDCVDRLRNAIQNARLRGSRIVVTKPSEDAESGS